MADKPSLLIVDDDPLITDTLAYALGKDFDVMVERLAQERGEPGAPAADARRSWRWWTWDCRRVPHRPDEGFQLIAELLAHSPAMKILVLSGQNDAANARHARTLGATDFVAKPCEAEGLKKLLLHALQFRAAEISGGAEAEGEQLIGASPVLEKLKSQISQYADSPFPALIEGESGSGKEVVASCLHRLSWRKDKPWFALNCAAIAPTLVEPTLFGYSKGAFTGANANKSGYFEDAQEGTLFLDEIGELPLELQAKLLRVLENGEFQRVGETQQRISHARVIAATNRDLRQEIRNGRFRADLYHRLSVFSISVPPLREMGEDKMLLLAHFSRFYAEQAKLAPFTLDRGRNRAVARLPLPRQCARAEEHRHPPHHQVPGAKAVGARTRTRTRAGRAAAAQRRATAELGPPGDPQTLIEQAQRHLQRERQFNLDDMLKAWEQGYIEAAMRLTHGNVSQAAKMLGINRTTLYSRMEQQDRK